jgi:lipopolysaccharide exporter
VVSLKLQTVRGALWTIATSLVTRGIGLVATLMLTWFVSPEAYGEAVAAAASVVFLAHRLSSVGGGQYIVAHPDAPRRVAFHMTVFHVALGAAALGGAVALVGPLSAWMRAPNLVRYLPGLALAAFIERVGYMPERVLVRDMRFRDISAVRAAGELTFSALTVGAAALGVGAFAYVLGNLARAAVRTAMFAAKVERRDWLELGPLDRGTTRVLVRYSRPMWLAGLFGQAAGKVDNMIISHFFGVGVAGLYNRAYNLADVPASQIGEQVGEVLLPSFARMDDLAQRRRAFVRATVALVFIVTPLALGLAAVSRELVATVLPPDFAPMGAMLTVLSVLSITRPIGWATYAFLIARDNVPALMIFEGIKLAIIVVGIVVAAPLGTLWACAAVGLAFAAHAFGSLAFVRRAQEIPLAPLVRGLVETLLASVPMVLAVVGARRALLAVGVAAPPVVLCAEVAAGAVGYLAGALVFAGSTLRELLALLREALRRRRGGE